MAPLFSPNHINYLPLVKKYYALFGAENVLVLPYEMFKLTPHLFIEKLGIFIDRKIEIDEKYFKVYHNRKKHFWIIYHFRRLNIFLRSNVLNYHSQYYNRYTRYLALKLQNMLGLLTPEKFNKKIKLRIKKFISNWVNDRYTENNKQLSKLIGVDLKKYGYFKKQE